MSGRLKAVLGAGALLAVVLVCAGIAASPRPGMDDPPPPPVPADVDAHIASIVAASASAGVAAIGTERLVRKAPGRTPLAFLYIHGFGATRGEGEAVVDALAADWSANAYYTRLPGHGQDMDAHAAATAEEWLATSAEALAISEALGEQVVVVGTSTGATLATWLAATYPDRVDALILASPFFDFPEAWQGPVLGSRGGTTLVSLVYGSVRDTSWDHPRKRDGYDERWTLAQRYSILAQLERVRRHGTRPEVFAAVTQPVLMMYYYASPTEHDEVVSIEAMRAGYAAMNGGDPHPRSRQVAVRDGNHVLLSQFVETDKKAVRMAIDVFLNNIFEM